MWCLMLFLCELGERDALDSMIKREEAAGPSEKPDEEPEDYASSASSWAPSDDGAQSGDSGTEMTDKKVKLDRSRRQYTNRRSSKKVIVPRHRANPVIPKMMKHANLINRKRQHNGTPKAIAMQSMNKSSPDSTRKNLQKGNPQNVSIDVRELIKIKNSFKTLFKMLEDMKRPVSMLDQTSNETVTEKINNTSQFNQSMEEDKEEMSEHEDFNRSDDNVLITNKYNNVKVTTAKNTGPKDDEWVPIGSGKTLIHKDQFVKVNWKSYTIATRTLLLAVFPRRILATHSLTGKRSPAFQDKPAKMCLDPKIISDVIMEIMDRFNVRENLVRSIITTKCADECKMWKNKVNKKKPRNQENIPPSSNSIIKGEKTES
ncbi:early boundary activity protein 2-like isoform X2 [Trichoplusia ni]|uniref:Early boundary activity protein 2-like isoform X2 n=2 Tax=Trichoplusia ni TaxID=7111 RepID=A0A7E5WZQ8_TRINI|nr:early boundary activity protein 2-like isoform X2 [Trichoplusia ni]